MRNFIRRVFEKLSSHDGISKAPDTPIDQSPVELDALEPRMLFSAAPVEADPPAADNPDEPPAEESVTESAEASPAEESTGSSQTVDQPVPVVSRDTAIDSAQQVNLIDLDIETERLNHKTLEAIAEAAAGHWRASGLSAEQDAALEQIEYGIADFADGSTLGSTEGFQITLDDDGSEKGWLVDGTASGIDLLTVLLHEQGHILGIDHSDTPGDLMFDALSRGERRMPAFGEADGAAPGEVVSIEFIHAGITTRTWTGGASNGLWNDVGNWSGGDVPDTVGEEAHFSGTASGAIDLGGATIGIGALHFSSLINPYTIQNGNLNVADILQENTATNTISAELDTAGITANVTGGNLVLSNQDNDATGTVTVGTGGTLSAALDGTGGALGTLDVNLNGGNLDVLPGAEETTAGAQAYLFNGNDTDLPGDSTQLATRILGGDVWFVDQNAVVAFWGDDILGVNNSGNPVDPQNFGHTYVGTFIPDDGDAIPGETLTVEFGHTSADDANRIRIDLNGNSTFENVVTEGDEDPYDADRGGTYATNKNLMLVEGQSYLVAIQGREGGGNVRLQPRVSFDNGGTWQNFNGAGFLTTDAVPEGTMNGTVTVSGSGGIDLASTVRTTTIANLVMGNGATLTVDSADMGQELEFSDVEVQGGDATFAGTGMPDVTLSNITETTATNLAFNADGVYTLDTNNTYTGSTTINNNASVIALANEALGSATSPADGTIVNDGGALVARAITTTENLTINGEGNSKFEGALSHLGGLGNTFWNGPVTVASDAEIRSSGGNELFFDAETTTIASGAELTLDADNRLNFRSAAKIAGDATTTLQISGTDRVDMETTIPDFHGTINLGSDGSDGHEVWGRLDVHAVDGGFGSSTGDTYVRGGEGSVIIRNSRTHNESFFIEGNGRGTEGAIRSEGGTNTIVGSVTLTGDADIYTNNSTLTIDGAVDGGGFDLNKRGTNVTSRLILTQDSVNLANLNLEHGQVRIQTEGGLGGTTSLNVDAGEAIEFDFGAIGPVTYDSVTVLDTLNVTGGRVELVSGELLFDATFIMNLGGVPEIASAAGTLTIDNQLDMGLGKIVFEGAGDITVNGDITGDVASGFVAAPSDISGLEAWYDASTITGLNNGDQVTAWADQSGNGRNLISYTGTPTLATNEINGLPAVRFNANNENLQMADPSNEYFAGDVYLVFRSANGASTKFGPSWGAPMGVKNGDDADRTWMFQPGEDRFWGSELPAAATRNGTAVSSANNFDMGGVDTSEYMVLQVAAGPNNGTQTREYIVGTRTDAWSNSRFDTAEVIAYDHHLSEDEKRAVNAYLAGKYDIAGSFAAPDFSNDVTKTGTGTLTLNGANTFNGDVTADGGTLIVANDDALGLNTTDGESGVVALSNDTTIVFSGGVTIDGENISGIDGKAAGQSGTIVNLDGNNTFNGDVSASSIPTAQDITINSESGSLTIGQAGDTFDVEFAKLTVEGAGDVTINNDISGEGAAGFVGLAQSYLFTGNDIDLPGDGSQIASKPIVGRDVYFLQEAESVAYWGDDLLGVGNAGNPIDPNNWSQSFVGTLLLDDGDASPGENVQVRVRMVSNDDAGTIYIDQDFDGLDTGDSVPPFNANGSGGSPTSGTLNLTEGIQYTVMLGAREGGGGSRLRPEISVDNGTTWQRFDLVDANTAGFQFGTEVTPIQELMKMGSGTLTLAGDNSAYDADIMVMEGTLVAASDGSLGTTAKGTDIQSGATLNVTATNSQESEVVFGDRVTLTPNAGAPLPSVSITSNAGNPLQLDVSGTDTDQFDLTFDITGTGLPGADNKFVLDQSGTERRLVDIGDATSPDSVDLPGGTVTFDDIGSGETFNTGAWSLTSKAVFNEFYWTGALSNAWSTAGNWVTAGGTVATSTPDDAGDAALFVHNGGTTSLAASVTVSRDAVTLAGDTIGGIFLQNSTVTDFTFSGGTLMTNGLKQSGDGTNTFATGATLTSSLFSGIVEAGTLTFDGTGNSATLADGEWHIKAGATLDVIANGATSGLGAADVDVFLDGGELDIDGEVATTVNALGHFGFNRFPDPSSGQGLMNLDGNTGMMNGGDPGSHPNLQGATQLTNGPGNRGLDFNNDADFQASGAITTNDNYTNLFVGHLNVPAGEGGNWQFRYSDIDDWRGMWIDLDQDGVFESSTPGLGSNRGEQLAWQDGGTKTVSLTAGQSYLVAFTHLEGGGGSRAEVQFRSPSMGAQAVIRPADVTQAGLWSFTAISEGTLTNNVIVTTDASTVDVSNSTDLGSLTFTDAGDTLNFDGGGSVAFTDPGAPTQSVSVEGDTAFNTANNTRITLNGIVENTTANLTYSGDGTGQFNLPEASDFNYTGTTTIDNTTVFADGVTNSTGADGLDQLGDTVTGTTIRNNGELQFSGWFDVGNEVRAVQEDFTLESGGILRHTGGGNAQLYSDITIGAGGGTIANNGNEFRTRTTIQTGGNDLTIESNSTIRFDGNGNIQGGANVESSGNGYTVLNHANDIGTMTVSNGRVQLNHNDALGGTGDTTVANGATLQFNGTRNVTENLTIEGNGEGNEGAIRTTGGTGSTLDGTVTLSGNSRFRIESDLSVTGLVSGTGNLEKNFSGDLRLEFANNTWDGTTTINGGRLIITSALGLGLDDSTGPFINNDSRLAFDGSGGSIVYDASIATITSGGFDNIDGHNKLTGTMEATNSGDLYLGADSGQFDIIGNIADSLSGDVIFDGEAGEINVVNSFGAGSLGTISTLNVTSGLQLWLDANDIDGAGDGATGDPGNGATVTTWADKSGNSRGASRGGATPTVVGSAINGLTGIDFDGNLDHLNVGGTSFFAKEQYVVFRSSHPTWDADNGGSAYGAVLGRTSGRGSNYLFENHATDFHTNQQPASVSRNGVDIPDLGGGSDFSVAPIDQYMMLRIEVNNNNATPGSYYVNRSDHSGADLEIAEIIAYDSTLGGSDRQQVEAYLLNKYALPGASRDVIKNGGSTVTLLGENDYTGSTTINGGTLVAASDMALGSSSNEVIINDGGTLALSNEDYDGGSMALVPGADVTVALDQVTINEGTGASGRGGAISNMSGDNTLNLGTVTVTETQATEVSFGSEAGTLSMNGANGVDAVDINIGNAALRFGGDGDLNLNANLSENTGSAAFDVVSGYLFSGNDIDLPGDGSQLATKLTSDSVYFLQEANSVAFWGDDLLGVGNAGNPIDPNNWAQSFVGDFTIDDGDGTPGENISVTFRMTSNDDAGTIYVDLNTNGLTTADAIFNSNGQGGSPSTARTLTEGVTYQVMLAGREGGGGSRLRPEFDLGDGNGFQQFDPGDMTNATFTTTVTATNTVLKEGAGTVALLGDNTGIDSTIDIQAGTLVATNSTSLGGNDDALGTTVAGTATLGLDTRGGAAFTLDENVTVIISSDDPAAGAGAGGMGVISNIAGDNTLSGDVDIVTEGLPPFHTDGLEAWYDASTISLSDGATVTAWEDSSGNGRDLVSWTGTPTFETNEINGLSAVRFNANNENLQMADPSNHYFANDVFLVFRAGQDGNGPTRTTFGPSWGAPIGVKDGNDANRTWMFQPGEDRFWSSELPSAVRRDGVDISSANNFDMGGSSVGEYMTLQVTAGPNNGTQVREYIVGTRTDAWANSRFDTAEVLAFNDVLTAAERQSVEEYLNVKYFGGTFIVPADVTITSKADELSLTGTVSDFETITFDGAGDTVVTQSLQQLAGSGGSLVKDGTGALTLSTLNTYTDGTTVKEGTLLANNASDSATGTGDVTVEDGGTLGGTGSVAGAVTTESGSTVDPGDSTIETLQVGGLAQTATTFAFHLEGGAGAGLPGGNDQLIIPDGVTLTGSELAINLVSGFTDPAPGAELILIDNLGSGAFTGTFNGLPEGNIVIAGDAGIPKLFSITYLGGDGNDVSLISALNQPTTNISVDGSGNLVISDIDSGGGSNGDSDDNVTVHVDGSEVVITDPGNVLGSLIPGANQVSENEIRIDVSLFTGDVLVQTLSGNDSITFGDLGNLVLPGGIAAEGGDDLDSVHYDGTGSVLNSGGDVSATGEHIAFLNGDLTTSDANVTLIGTGEGILFDNTTLTINGTGGLDLSGTSNETGSGRHGLSLIDSTVSTTTGSGSVTLNGTGSANGTDDNVGVFLSNSDIGTGGAGGIDIDGTSNASGDDNHGIALNGGTLSTTAGSGSVTLNGTGSDSGTDDNVGVFLFGTQINTGGAGNINVDGSGNGSGSGNRGIRLTDGTFSTTTGSGSVTLTGTGGVGGTSNNDGVLLSGTEVSTGGNGSIDIDGTGNGAGAGSTGVSLLADSDLTASGGGTISIDGTGSDTGSGQDHGVSIGADSELTVANGDLSINGVADSTGRGNSHGVSGTGVALAGTGTGDIRVTGSSSSAGSSNRGISLFGGTISTASGSGSIILNGTGSDNSLHFNNGILLSDIDLNAGGGGSIEIDGTGNGSEAGNTGVSLQEDTNLAVTGAGTISVDGTGSTSGRSGNQGVALGYGSDLSVVDGDLTINGTGAGGNGGNANGVAGNSITLSGTGSGSILVSGSSSSGGSNNRGVWLTDGSITTVGGSITLTGDGSTSGAANNEGVHLSNTDLTAGTGTSIDIDGQGGGTGTGNTGVSLANDSNLAVTGLGTITVDGTGSAVGTSANSGVSITGGSGATSVDGGITLIGTGDGTGNQNRGIRLSNALVESTGGGSVILTGTAALSATNGSYNSGIYSSGTTLRANSGDLVISGIGGTLGKSFNVGVQISGGTAESTAGTLTIDGTAGASTSRSDNFGVYILGASVGGGSGAEIRGTGGSGTGFNHGVYLQSIVVGAGTLIPGGDIFGTVTDGNPSSEETFGNFF